MIKDFFPKLDRKPQIYAYSVPQYPGLLKIGYTENDVEKRVAEQFPVIQPNSKPFTICLAESAITYDGRMFDDHAVHDVLRKRGFHKRRGEWFECTTADVRAAVIAVRSGHIDTVRTNDFQARQEQLDAVRCTSAYFRTEKEAHPDHTPKYLWNCKMRFGKCFAAYKLAQVMGFKRVLVITFKPAVQASWESDLTSHVDFTDWKFVKVQEKTSYDGIGRDDRIVAFGSFQDLLGRNEVGGIKSKNEWVHSLNWDMVIFDEYHFGAWRDTAKDLFEPDNSDADADMDLVDNNILPITADYMLYLSGTPFRAIRTGEFLEDQIFNWTYSDEQKAKESWKEPPANPYRALPTMIMMTYQMPESVTQIALGGEYDEFDLNEFFAAEGDGDEAKFKHEDEVQRWLDIIRGKSGISTVEQLKMGAARPALPYSDMRLRPLLQHTLWYLPRVSSCYAMRNLLHKNVNSWYHKDYTIIVAAGTQAGIGVQAYEKAMEQIKVSERSITLTCGKLTTGVTVPQWSGIFMLRSLTSPESYFQAAFRVQSPWEAKAQDATMSNVVMKETCYVFDFAPNRALRQIVDYSCKLNTGVESSEKKVAEFVNFLPVIAFDGSQMIPINAGQILDMAMSGTTASLLAKKWESALLVNVDNSTIEKILANQDAYDAIMRIEGFRKLNGGKNPFELIVNETADIKERRARADEEIPSATEKREITEEEKKVHDLRKKIQERLVKFSTRIPVFMYLTDYREETLEDVILELEPELFRKVTGLDLKDFNMLVEVGVFNRSQMNSAVYAFRRYEDSSLTYAGIDRHSGENIGGWDSTLSPEEFRNLA